MLKKQVEKTTIPPPSMYKKKVAPQYRKHFSQMCLENWG